MRPPGPRASGSRRRGPPRSARIRDAGPAEGTNADPPLRLWLPREKPSFPVPRRPRPAPETTRRGEKLSELPPPRRPSAPRPGHRLQNGARGSRPRAFPGASPPEGGACPQWRARTRGGREWATPTQERALPGAAGGLPPPGSTRLLLLGDFWFWCQSGRAGAKEMSKRDYLWLKLES